MIKNLKAIDMQELMFTCELCKSNFPADSDSMLECGADFTGIDPITGKERLLTEEEVFALTKQMKLNPEIAPFLKGAICVCHKCQDEWHRQAEFLY